MKRSKIIVRYNPITKCDEYRYTEIWCNKPINIILEYNKQNNVTYITVRYNDKMFHEIKNCKAVSVHHFIRDFKYFMKEVKRNEI